MDNEKISLFIPAGLKAEREYFQGFARKELMQAFFGSIGVLIVTAIGYAVSGSILVVMGILGIGELIVVSVVTRSPVTNLSIVSMVKHYINYLKDQQDYRYRMEREVRTDDLISYRRRSQE